MRRQMEAEERLRKLEESNLNDEELANQRHLLRQRIEVALLSNEAVIPIDMQEDKRLAEEERQRKIAEQENKLRLEQEALREQSEAIKAEQEVRSLPHCC